MRKLTYAQALNEALRQLLSSDERTVLIGQGIKSPWYVGTTTEGLVSEFGERRVIDTPVSENGITGVAIGAALAGMRPIVEHPRMDFMYLAMDQIINNAANWHYMFGGSTSVPLTIWGIINRGGEQAAQHSQAIQAMFAHVPGLKVVMPSTPYDAKGLLVSAVRDDNPVLFIDDRWLYQIEGEVPERLYEVPIGKAIIRQPGIEVTVAATSFMVHQALKAGRVLSEQEIEIEIIDLRSLKPMDTELLFDSVKKTGRLVVADAAWKTCGVAAEVAAITTENVFEYLKAPVLRVTLPDAPAPASSPLEKAYYPTAGDIVEAVQKVLERGRKKDFKAN
jgi:pyruvate dehydrogenase E1 component beta subunit